MDFQTTSETIGILDPSDRQNIESYYDVISRDLTYRDLDLRFVFHPSKNSLITLKDAAAVKRSLYNLLMTEPGEKPFNSSYGTPLASMLFELAELNSMTLRNRVKAAIKRFEPRVDVISVDYDTDAVDSNAIECTIRYRIINTSRQDTLEIFLERIK